MARRLACATFGLVAICCVVYTAVTAAKPGNPNALWQIVSGRCVPEALAGLGERTCIKVDLEAGYAILKDLVGPAQYLLIPTERITGIEDPRLIAPDARNYWQQAFSARELVGRALGVRLEPEDVGLAVNSMSGRSQNQFHIHIDCMAPQVVAALAADRYALGPGWRDLPEPLSGHRYRMRVIPDLGTYNIFAMLADDIRHRGEVMADETLLLTEIRMPDGGTATIVLNDHVQNGNLASSEELQDHACSIRAQRPRLAPAARTAP